ncbi:hypothetical protein A3K55_01195 [Candidatus Shapirobacteria bacterium RBG_13_44_7]|uniref:Uncharacterized protein n=1 Tax=Candidatus Shapirobacteria bacterium RBG_13_44_7 TaxID=1802149 RepID=A0A1F7SHA3_9BACT|nr:MAG: hypothetical protein A3K55_01195 [Candidatus Shapirobacteria bacterium RBG_13_44_7]
MNWSYSDFCLPIRRGNKSPLTKKVVVFLLIQFAATLILWSLIRDIIGSNSGFNSNKGRTPNTISDLLVFLIWFGLARVSWHLYHQTES